MQYHSWAIWKKHLSCFAASLVEGLCKPLFTLLSLYLGLPATPLLQNGEPTLSNLTVLNLYWDTGSDDSENEKFAVLNNGNDE